MTEHKANITMRLCGKDVVLVQRASLRPEVWWVRMTANDRLVLADATSLQPIKQVQKGLVQNAS